MNIIRQFGKFGSVAVGSALTDLAIFSLLIWLRVDPFVAQINARLTGGVFAFTANKFWSFKADGWAPLFREARRFLLLYAASYLLNLTLLYLLLEQGSLNVFVAKITADLVCFFFNFLVMKLYVFSETRGISRSLTKLLKLPNR